MAQQIHRVRNIDESFLDSEFAPRSQTAVLPISLQHRLRLFALGCGALGATVVEQPARRAELVITAWDGTRLTVAIDGCAWKWHQALDRMEQLYDEQSEAGLHRFLGLKRAA